MPRLERSLVYIVPLIVFRKDHLTAKCQAFFSWSKVPLPVRECETVHLLSKSQLVERTSQGRIQKISCFLVVSVLTLQRHVIDFDLPDLQVDCCLFVLQVVVMVSVPLVSLSLSVVSINQNKYYSQLYPTCLIVSRGKEGKFCLGEGSRPGSVNPTRAAVTSILIHQSRCIRPDPGRSIPMLIIRLAIMSLSSVMIIL